MKVLRVKQSDQRSALFQKTLAMGEEYQRQTKFLLLRVALLRQDLVVSQGQGQGHGNQTVDEHHM
jgi:COP9 signalosome complex subunit 1